MRPMGDGALLAALAIALLPAAALAGECVETEPQPPWCFEHVLCTEYQDYWDVRRSVVYLYGPDIEGSGVLINNAECSTNGGDPKVGDEGCGTPYLLTALHVISGEIGEVPTAGEIHDVENETVTITAGVEVRLVDGFHADLGSTIVVEVGP